jgi:hypothetical protein
MWAVQLRKRVASGVVVLGMGRSGTSAVAGMFAAAGFYPGRDLDLFAGDQHNPRGYFEHKAIFRVNEEILGELGATWYQPPSAQAQIAARASVSGRLQDALERLLAEAGGAPVVLKDPRIGAMWELWGPMLAGRLHPVMVIRDPLEVALSLQRRDGTPVPFGLAAWELHMEGLLRDLRGCVVTVAPYAGLARAPELAGEIVACTVPNLTAERTGRVDPSAASAGFDPKLYRNRPGPDAHEETLTIHQHELWTYLAALPAGDQRIEAPARLLRDSAASRSVVAAERTRLDDAERLRVNEKLLASRDACLAAERAQVEQAMALQEQEQDRLKAIIRSEQRRLQAELREALAQQARLTLALVEARASEATQRATGSPG